MIIEKSTFNSEKWTLGFIFLFAFSLYANTLRNGYALDDHLVTTSAHPQISKGLAAIPEIFTTHYVSWNDYDVDYRPLVKAIFAVEYQLFGENPMVGHLISALLYGLSCMLIFRILAQLFPDQERWKLIAAVLIFAAHPVHTEVVASIKGRDELLSMLFMLMAFLLALDWAKNGKRSRLLLFAVCVYMSILCKLSALPWLAIMSFTIYRIKRQPLAKVITMVSVSLIMVAAHVVIIKLLFDGISRPYIFIESPYTLTTHVDLKWPSNIASAGYYLKLLLLPYPLCSYYGYDQIPMASLSDWRVYVSLVAYAGLIALALRAFKTPTLITVGALILLLDLSPMYNIVYPYPGILGERALYGATIGFGMISIGVLEMLIKDQRIRIGLVGIVLVAASIRTVGRNFDWKDNLTLFAADARNCERSVKLHELHALYLRGEYMNNELANFQPLAHQAIGEYKQCISIYDKWPVPFHRIGVIYHYDLGLPDSAKYYYQQAIFLNPKHLIARQDLAACLSTLGDHKEAARQFRNLVLHDASDPTNWNSLVASYFLAGQLEQADSSNRFFLQKFPMRDEPHIHAGNLIMARGDTASAIHHFDRALELNQKNEAFRRYLVNLKAELDTSM